MVLSSSSLLMGTTSSLLSSFVHASINVHKPPRSGSGSSK